MKVIVKDMYENMPFELDLPKQVYDLTDDEIIIQVSMRRGVIIGAEVRQWRRIHCSGGKANVSE